MFGTEAGGVRVEFSLQRLAVKPPGRPFLGDGDGKANETVGSTVLWHGGGLGARDVRFGLGRRCRPGGPGSRAQQPLVPRSAMGPSLGQQLPLGLESVPRLARSGPGGLGTLGASAAVGTTGSASTGVGAPGSPDVEPDFRCLGIL